MKIAYSYWMKDDPDRVRTVALEHTAYWRDLDCPVSGRAVRRSVGWLDHFRGRFVRASGGDHCGRSLRAGGAAGELRGEAVDARIGLHAAELAGRGRRRGRSGGSWRTAARPRRSVLERASARRFRKRRAERGWVTARTVCSIDQFHPGSASALFGQTTHLILAAAAQTLFNRTPHPFG
jgi:hypothetical protein